MIKLNVSDIQRFSVGDGDGIRTTVFLKGCNMHCPWCHNPETIKPITQTLRYRESGKEKVSGKLMTAEEIYEVISEDEEFYMASGGGVTISGGEAMMQADGVRELCKLLKDNNIHVIMDTAGNVPYSEFEKLDGLIDLYFYDFKAAEKDDYFKVTGGNLDLIYSNLCRLIKENKEVRIRIPLIEGFNTSKEYTLKMCEKLKEAGAKRVDLLPFHRLGSAKYKALGIEYEYASVPSMTLSRAEEIAEIYRQYFITKIEK